MNRIFGISLALLMAAPILLAPPAARAADDPWQKVLKRDFGTEEEAMKAIREQVEAAPPEKCAALEAKVLAIVNSSEATVPAKQFACRMLRYVGSSKCVPAMAGLLTDEKLSHMARWVLQGVADASAEDALIAALKSAKGKIRIGIIETLGERGSVKALPMMSSLSYNKDVATANAALKAIAAIGGQAGADTLAKIATTKTTRAMWCDAALTCAGDLAAAGKADQATKIVEAIFEDAGNPSVARAAALGSLIASRKLGAMELIMKALKSGDRRVAQAAAGPMIQIKGADASAAFAKELPDLPAAGQVVVLNVLAARGDKGAATAVSKMVASDNEGVRIAAITALATVGDAGSVKILAGRLGAAKNESDAAKNALMTIEGNGVFDEMIQAAQAGPVEASKVLLGVLSARKAKQAVPMAYNKAADKSFGARSDAVRLIGALGGAEDVAKLTGLVLAETDGGMKNEYAQALRSVAVRSKQIDPVLAAWKKATDADKVKFLETLGAAQGDKALGVVKGELNAKNIEIKKAAVSALKGWNNDKPMKDLLGIAKGDSNKICRVLALQGYINMIPKVRDEKARLDACMTAMGLATRPDEKRQALSVIGNIRNVAALKLASKYLEDPQVKREALEAAGQIALNIASKHPDEARPILEKFVKSSKNRRQVNRAKRTLSQIKDKKSK